MEENNGNVQVIVYLKNGNTEGILCPNVDIFDTYAVFSGPNMGTIYPLANIEKICYQGKDIEWGDEDVLD